MSAQHLDFLRLKEANKIADLKDQKLYGGFFPFLDILGKRGLIIPEIFFGSGFHHGQSASLAQLELLIVLNSYYQKISDNDEQLSNAGILTYHATKQILLRALIFNNPSIEFFNNNINYTEEQKWEYWAQYFHQTNLKAEYLSDKIKALQQQVSHKPELAEKIQELEEQNTILLYNNSVFAKEQLLALKSKFTNFAEFTAFISLLKNMYVFKIQDSSWIYTFLFPLGDQALFIEINSMFRAKQNNIAGVGTALFMMLYRANQGKEVLHKLYQKFIVEEDPLNQVLALLSDAKHEAIYTGQTKFLPLQKHFVYEQLAQDVLVLIELNLTKEELFYALCRIFYLNLLVYFFDRMCTVCNSNNQPKEFAFFIDVANTSDTSNVAIHNTSILTFTRNKNLLHESIICYTSTRLHNFLQEYDSSLLNEALNKEQCIALCSLLNYVFGSAFLQQTDKKGESNKILKPYDFKFDEHIDHELSAKYKENVISLNSLINEISSTILNNGSYKHCASTYAVDIGLKSKSNTQKNYTLSDSLLKTLAITIIPTTEKYMTLPEFLSCLKERYHIVIDSHDFMPDINIHKDQLSLNRDNFIKQLNRTNLLVQLSDNSTSYVRNPCA